LLSRPPENICIGQVIRLIDGPLAPIACVSQTAYERCSCPDEEHCGLRMLMIDVRNAIANILDRYTLADVVEITLRKLRKNRMPLLFSLGFLEQLSENRSDGQKSRMARLPSTK
jgi:DNA-binding IscR family transcriptional regulator